MSSVAMSCLSLVLSFLEEKDLSMGLGGHLAGYLLKCLVRPARPTEGQTCPVKRP